MHNLTKNTIAKVLLMIGIIALSLCAKAGQLSPIAGTAYGGGSTSTNAATGVTVLPLTTYANPNSSIIGMQVSFSCSTSNGAAVTFGLDSSFDNVRWVTNAIIWPITATSSVEKVASTNLSGVPAMWRIGSILSPGGDVTNLVVVVFNKSGI